MFRTQKPNPSTTNKELSILNYDVMDTPKLTLQDLDVVHRVYWPPRVSATQNADAEENVEDAIGRSNNSREKKHWPFSSSLQVDVFRLP